MDYSKLMYDPFDPQTVKELEKYEEFQFSCRNKQQVIAYMIIMYDYNNTELRRLYPDFFTRKREAALMAGLKPEKSGHFSEETENILTGQNDEFNRALVRFLLMFGHPDYPTLMGLREMHAKELEASMKGSSKPQDRRVILENLEKSAERIARMESMIFSGVEVENVRRALYVQLEADRAGLRPEVIAQRIRDRKLGWDAS